MSDKKYYAMIKGESGELEEVEIIGGNVINNTALWSEGIVINDKVDCVIKDNQFNWGKDPIKDIEEMKRICLEGKEGWLKK